jgi:predicted DNA-binding protein with PD1-like motif
MRARHAHAVRADKNGNTKAGHFIEGTVFAAEVHMRELKETEMKRKYGKVTGLSIWRIK